MRSNSRESRGTLPALTSIRFFAALWVVMSHLAVLDFLNFSAPVRWVAGDSRPAVTFFFVLSGFILAHNYGGDLDRDRVRRFYVARFARIYPMLVLSLLLAVPVTAILLIGDDRVHLYEWYGIAGNPTLPLAVGLIAQLFALTGWLPFSSINQPWNGPAWSISCEAFFYLCFPLLVTFVKRLTPQRRALLLVAGFCAQGLWIAGVRELLPFSRNAFIVAQFPLTHLFEFVLGIAMQRYCWEWQSGGQPRDREGRIGVALGLAGVAALMVWRPVDPAYYLLSPCYALVIGGLALQRQPVWGVLGARPLVLLGEASFSLYLIHVPVIHLAKLAGLGHSAGVALLLGTVLLSVILFCAIERPLRGAILRRYGHRSASTARSAVTA